MSFRLFCSLLCVAFSFSAHSASVHLSPCDEKLSQKWTLRNRALMNADNCVVETEETGEFELGACETSSSLEFDKQMGRIVQRTSGLCLDCSSYAKSRSWNVEIKHVGFSVRGFRAALAEFVTVGIRSWIGYQRQQRPSNPQRSHNGWFSCRVLPCFRLVSRSLGECSRTQKY
ncbi:uncharacterized protein [Oscarella lobularis]|uniref:uncharacterized protein isoform X2 n=1 Tax=Oscarella lobularis TaxID=121494 RepID=UPI003313378F